MKKKESRRETLRSLEEREEVLLKNGTKDFQKSPPFERSRCCYMSNTADF